MKEKIKKELPSIIFNLAETLLLIGMAWLLKVGIKNTIIVFLSFQLGRAIFKQPKHFKSWKKCLIWTLSIFTTLFLVVNVDLSVGILTSVFTSYILSGKSDLKDMYMWKKDKMSKYQKLIDYIKFNGLNDELIKAENNLKNLDNIMYIAYKRRFRENKTFKEITEELDMDNARLVEILDKAYFYFIGALKI